MKDTANDMIAISRITGGEGFILPTVRFGPLHATALARQVRERRARLLNFPHLTEQHDRLIRQVFERIRNGLSADRFLSDPKLSKLLQQECRKLGLTAEEPAINLRLLAIRKRPGGGMLKETRLPARARHLVERLGPGVEAAMRFVLLRFGASVDDMLAHPMIGQEFVEFASTISPGGSGVEYRLTALQIRKGRHLTGVYEERVSELHSRMIEGKWMKLGTADEAARRSIPLSPGLIELRTMEHHLYVLRTAHLAKTVESTLRPERIRSLLRADLFGELRYEDANLRFVTNRDLVFGTPKAWELRLIVDYQPLFNWPVTEN